MLYLTVLSLIVAVFALIYSHFCVPFVVWSKLGANPKDVSQLSSFQQLYLFAGCIIQLSNILTIIDASLSIYYSSNFESSTDQHWTPILLYALSPLTMLLIAAMVMCAVQRNRHIGVYEPDSAQDRMQGLLGKLAVVFALLSAVLLILIDICFAGGTLKNVMRFLVILIYGLTFGCALIAYPFMMSGNMSIQAANDLHQTSKNELHKLTLDQRKQLKQVSRMRMIMFRYALAIIFFIVGGFVSNVLSVVFPEFTNEFHWILFRSVSLIYITVFKTLSIQLEGMERFKNAPKALTSFEASKEAVPPTYLRPVADSHENYVFDAIITQTVKYNNNNDSEDVDRIELRKIEPASQGGRNGPTNQKNKS